MIPGNKSIYHYLKISIRITSISFSKMSLTFYIIRIKMIINIDDIDKTQFYNHIF